jgi:DNA-binding NarL/FixJ family response regulator
MKRVSVLLADDHAIVVEGLRHVLEPEFEVVRTVADGHALVTAARDLRPDIIVADISMPLLNGIEAIRQIRQDDPHVKIVFLTMHADVVYATEAFLAGASCYVLKSSAGTEVVTAIREALLGHRYVSIALDRRSLDAQLQGNRPSAQNLPPRQREVVQMTAEGRSTKQIADILHISPRTVEFHRYRAMASLGLHTLAELVQYAIKQRWVS